MNRRGCLLNPDSELGNAFHPLGMFMNVKEMLRYKRPFPRFHFIPKCNKSLLCGISNEVAGKNSPEEFEKYSSIKRLL